MLRGRFVLGSLVYAAAAFLGRPASARPAGRFTFFFAWELQPPVPVGDVSGLDPLALKAGPEIAMTLPVASLARLQMWFADVDRGVASARKSAQIVASNEFGAEVARFSFDRMVPVGYTDADRKATAPVHIRFRYATVAAAK
jgi:hypothetical protein